jgi:type IV pilus assembly protein PilB
MSWSSRAARDLARARPTLYGEKSCCVSSAAEARDRGAGLRSRTSACAALRNRAPYGMILVTGHRQRQDRVALPVSTSLTSRASTSRPRRSAKSLPGVNQVNVSEKAGLTCASSRAFLRQDPASSWWARSATWKPPIFRSRRGKPVTRASTLHTSDAPATLMRLSSMGVPAFNIASSVILITAQRLCRKLCPKCKSRGHPPRSPAGRFRQST